MVPWDTVPRLLCSSLNLPCDSIHTQPVPLWAMASRHLVLSSLSTHNLYKLAASITLSILLYERRLDSRQRQMRMLSKLTLDLQHW